jgi:type VI secretion system protein ImpG
MRDELLGYYERELAYLRQLGSEFARRYPKIAGRLLLEPSKCDDPHVERILEAFAFLAARVHLKLDDEFPEITDSFLNVLYPHYLAPIPSMSIAQFALEPQQGKLTTSYTIDRHTVLYSRPVQGTPCRFRTCYPTTVWPIDVVGASLESPAPPDSRGRWPEALLRITLRCNSQTKLSELKRGLDERAGVIDRLRFYLNGEPQVVYPLYELIFNNASRVELVPAASTGPRVRDRKPPRPIGLDVSNIRAVGFEEGDGLLPYGPRSFAGYRLLTEYFSLPEKFLFFDVTGLDAAARAGFEEEFAIVIHLRDVAPLRRPVDATTFQLGCTPIVNLFERVAEPIRLTQQQHEYRVIPDVHRQMATEVYSIDSATTTDPYLKQSREFKPFYSYRHARDRDEDRTFWYATRRPSQRENDAGTEVSISLVDLDLNPSVPAVDTLTVRVTCTNRDIPGRLPFGGNEGEFQIETSAPMKPVRCLRKPTGTLRPPLGRGAQWRLISHLTLNPLSIVNPDPDGEPHALREILLLYDFLDSSATRKQIAGIRRVSSRPVVRQVGPRIGTGYVRGIETTVELDEDEFVGAGPYLFGAVLDRFLGLYASTNSFNELLVSSLQREGYIKRWRPRAGEQILL